MAKPALIIDMLAGPKDGEDEDDEVPTDDEPAAASTDAESIITGIEQQLQKLRGAL